MQEIMFWRHRRDTRFAKDLIKVSLSDAGLSEFGHYPLFLAIRHVFDRSLDGAPNVRKCSPWPKRHYGGQSPNG